jgi:hypothetical protein
VRILAIDPGNVESAYVVFDGTNILQFGKVANDDMRPVIRQARMDGATLACEMIASYGMSVGATVFDTCVWIGRFLECWGTTQSMRLITRVKVKSHICHSAKAKDSNIRQALIDRFGEPGTKKNPGVTYGISKDVWAALAVAVTAWDQAMEQRRSA